MKEKLTQLLYEAEGKVNNDLPRLEQIAEYLIKHGVTVKGYEYFSPQQVRNMSPKEIRENYTATQSASRMMSAKKHLQGSKVKSNVSSVRTADAQRRMLAASTIGTAGAPNTKRSTRIASGMAQSSRFSTVSRTAMLTASAPVGAIRYAVVSM